MTEYDSDGGFGRLEVRSNNYNNGIWGSMCVSSLVPYTLLAEKLCKYLGYKSLIRVIKLPALHPSYPVNVGLSLTGISCLQMYRGTFEECVKDDWGTDICDHTQDVGLQCESGKKYISETSELY